jgi:protoporphyrinogen oxidase
MERAGIFRPHDELVVADVRDIRYAYVLFDRHRARVLTEIFAELERRAIHSIGRYGRWEHTSMEDAIAQGKQLAERLSSRYGELEVQAG